MMFDMVSAENFQGSQVVALYDEWTAQWHEHDETTRAAGSTDPFTTVMEDLHRANFRLWHLEDKTRDPNAGDNAVAAAKRAIDRVNQQRNDQVERCDMLLLETLKPQGLPNPRAELHSETPGQMLDRLSILSLRRYHTLEEVARVQAPAGHAERNRERLEILNAQRNDLAQCLTRLWQRVLRGELRFQVYRQLKMYNDPELNPVLYRHS